MCHRWAAIEGSEKKIVHHRVPLFLEGILEQDFDRISCSLVFLSFRHGGSSGLRGLTPYTLAALGT